MREQSFHSWLRDTVHHGGWSLVAGTVDARGGRLLQDTGQPTQRAQQEVGTPRKPMFCLLRNLLPPAKPLKVPLPP